MTDRDVDKETGLTIRTRNALIRADFGGGEMGEFHHLGPSLNRAKIAAALESGSILEVRLIGRKSINEIREWLARSEPQPDNEKVTP